MNRKFKVMTSLVALIIITVVFTIFLVGDRDATMFDLRDGTRLEIVRVSFSTNHVAHFGTLPQKVLFKIAGGRFSEKWVGHRMVIRSQVNIEGNLGIFVRHHVDPGNHEVHDYKIKPVSQPRKEHSMFLSAGDGERGLWELNYWNEDYSNFLIENSKGQLVGRFRIMKDGRGRYGIVSLGVSTGKEDGSSNHTTMSNAPAAQ